MHDFKKLKVWGLAMDLAADIYKTTNSFPKSEIYGLTSQIRRSSVSIPCNIAEGAGRNSNKEFVKYLYYSYGSTCELETQVILCQRLGFLEISIVQAITGRIIEIQKIIFSLITKYKEE